MSYLYILDINPLLIISFANIFSHSVACLFILSVISFAVQKFLNLIRSHLEKAGAPHSSTRAWRIPWTEQPGGLQSLWGLQESDVTEQPSTHSSSLSGNRLPAYGPLHKPKPDSKPLKLGCVLKPELRLPSVRRGRLCYLFSNRLFILPML